MALDRGGGIGVRYDPCVVTDQVLLLLYTVYPYSIRSKTQMKFFEGHKLIAVRARLALAVKEIVERHRTAGQVLTWRLVHEIEKEAIQTLEQAGDLDVKYIRMVRSSRWGYVPRVNQPAVLEGHEELPLALTMIQNAYHAVH
ncbi:MAG: hypothetical protein JWQ00_2453 [Noviherbaspirillum sp.]|nr:hypothetical protein [Noviherbaspirillum sp.]